ncbi:hypothetical protein PR048_018867 [Dryococelus australis]|uniref:Uncharacterized protein n=1 Tax=Dryococelus australis TaxID=614101 RepID=A0ABQ9H1Z9_9NEOP|nr:hypothetical protein PR048_018867 [Dryococelus australis]
MNQVILKKKNTAFGYPVCKWMSKQKCVHPYVNANFLKGAFVTSFVELRDLEHNDSLLSSPANRRDIRIVKPVMGGSLYFNCEIISYCKQWLIRIIVSYILMWARLVKKLTALYLKGPRYGMEYVIIPSTYLHPNLCMEQEDRDCPPNLLGMRHLVYINIVLRNYACSRDGYNVERTLSITGLEEVADATTGVIGNGGFNVIHNRNIWAEYVVSNVGKVP